MLATVAVQQRKAWPDPQFWGLCHACARLVRGWDRPPVALHIREYARPVISREEANMGDQRAASAAFREWLWEQTGIHGLVSRDAAREKALALGVLPKFLGSLINQSRHERVGNEYRRIADREPPPPVIVPHPADLLSEEEEPDPGAGQRLDRVARLIRAARSLGVPADELIAWRGRLLGGDWDGSR